MKTTPITIALVGLTICLQSASAANPNLQELKDDIVSIRWNAGELSNLLMGVNELTLPGVGSGERRRQAVTDRFGVNTPRVVEIESSGLNTRNPGPTTYTKQTIRATGFRMGTRIVTILSAAERGNESLAIHDAKGNEHKPTIVAWDSSSGLTVLEIDATGDGPVDDINSGFVLANSDVAWGDQVQLMHEWRKNNPALISGIVSTSPQYDGAIRSMSFDIDAFVPRNAIGAPVLNAGREVVGVIDGQRSSTGDSGPGIAIPPGRLRKLLAFVDSGSKGPLPKAMLGVALATTPDGALVAKVIAESAADVAGFTEGDSILSVNNQPVNRIEEVIAAIDQFSPGDTVTIRVRPVADGEIVEREVALQAMPDRPEAVDRTAVVTLSDALRVIEDSEESPARLRRIIKEIREKHLGNPAESSDSTILERLNISGLPLDSAISITAVPPDVNRQLEEIRQQIAEIRELLEKKQDD